MLKEKFKRVGVPIVLFIATIITVTLAGAEHQNFQSIIHHKNKDEWGVFLSGLYFSIPFISILLTHELGHYLTARYYKIKTSLPLFIPFWLPLVGSGLLGTFGAIIKQRSASKSNQQQFDVGIAGPLAGFVVAIGLLIYGFTHLPAKEKVFDIHPDYAQHGENYAKVVYEYKHLRKEILEQHKKIQKAFAAKGDTLRDLTEEDIELYTSEVFRFGESLMWKFFKNYVASDPKEVPNMYELMHYPYLMAGYFALFFTALNLLPIGQLDGGHVIYGLFGSKWHTRISITAFSLFIGYAGLGFVQPDTAQLDSTILKIVIFLGIHYLVYNRILKDPLKAGIIAVSFLVVQLVIYLLTHAEGYSTWFVFSLMIGLFLGVYHPKAPQEVKLSKGRIVLGILSIIIFVLCFVPQIVVFVEVP